MSELNNFNMKYFELQDKVAIITGANKGLGQAYAVALAEAGADIYITYLSGDIEETRKLIEDKGRKVHFLQIDLTKENAANIVINDCLEKYGKVDILINNAGTIKRSPLLEYKDEDWNTVIDINLNSVYYLSQRAAIEMVKQGGGKIINVASMLSFQGGKFVPPYTASKHGVAGITKAFANELADKNIQVNAIAPGYIKTDNTQPIREDEKRNKEILDRIPAGHWAETSELMGTIVFLSSRASDYVNGHILAVDGGWLVR
ncbi:2-dehydro-3-deoxy-D-gluconate 5-dehydrogenase KduD [Helcococcus kunzii]|uniref:2-deoxy-D-gluconate 3-dehydrogenase n=1 Tax=Helcococcus kunzii ATCC 51366 TaxID=883114 RepID=H3NQL2_9FIRM|nr:2-dehydro-3-deoxy-D-gluconate 5-dehydrogenase KduD [Helcococcus kunzii]EHR32342.1 2-deoxy-D-gluconate 3-dehydrogenase [Helcococcus kunzii ATCC 51366]QUY65477.1 2-dehydro-3-deoxy-D-gluconate 5-dehydrogenase KduD [Helcococcus kunzii]QZO76135.1 2-dehydro-3-deoxy-D-gluconate 5-dehydrogenase KduD [Helcococcus kunzii]